MMTEQSLANQLADFLGLDPSLVRIGPPSSIGRVIFINGNKTRILWDVLPGSLPKKIPNYVLEGLKREMEELGHFYLGASKICDLSSKQLKYGIEYMKAMAEGTGLPYKSVLNAIQEASLWNIILAELQSELKQRELSEDAKAARMSLAPEELVDAKHDRVHREPGRARAARTIRNK